jgi:hypothetical protein
MLEDELVQGLACTEPAFIHETELSRVLERGVYDRMLNIGSRILLLTSSLHACDEIPCLSLLLFLTIRYVNVVRNHTEGPCDRKACLSGYYPLTNRYDNGVITLKGI